MMRATTTLVLCMLMIQCLVATAMEKMGPIALCEEEDKRLADRASCTRFHICRTDEKTDQFVTELLICPGEMVFDMVTATCVTSSSGYLQDPAGCNTFYGCHATRETSEGFVRRHYQCSGDLRFHPQDKWCTFKTYVPDTLCNSKDTEQAILGTDTVARATTITDEQDMSPIPFRASSNYYNRRRQGSSIRTTSYRTGFRKTSGLATNAINNEDKRSPTATTALDSSATSLGDGDEGWSPGYLFKTASDIDRATAIIRDQLVNAAAPQTHNKANNKTASTSQDSESNVVSNDYTIATTMTESPLEISPWSSTASTTGVLTSISSSRSTDIPNSSKSSSMMTHSSLIVSGNNNPTTPEPTPNDGSTEPVSTSLMMNSNSKLGYTMAGPNSFIFNNPGMMPNSVITHAQLSVNNSD